MRKALEYRSILSSPSLNERLELLARIESHVRRHDLIAPEDGVLCLVSGGADSTCLSPRSRARLSRRGAARRYGSRRRVGHRRGLVRRAVRCRGRPRRRRCGTEAALRDVATPSAPMTCARPATRCRTRSRRSSTGSRRGEPRRGSRCAAPTASCGLCSGWREETEAFCRERGLKWRTDSSNPDTLRGVIRNQILSLLERIHPAPRENVLRVLDERRTMPRALVSCSARPPARSESTRRGAAGRARVRPGLARAGPA